MREAHRLCLRGLEATFLASRFVIGATVIVCVGMVAVFLRIWQSPSTEKRLSWLCVCRHTV